LIETIRFAVFHPDWLKEGTLARQFPIIHPIYAKSDRLEPSRLEFSAQASTFFHYSKRRHHPCEQEKHVWSGWLLACWFSPRSSGAEGMMAISHLLRW